MCEQTEIQYLDGEVVWVKLGSCWWPGEVVGSEKLPPDVLSSFRKPPIAVVKFFQEDTYEYVKNINGIYKYNCSRKDEFIRKGLSLFRSKRGKMEKFPDDVVHAESVTDGDTGILTREDFQEAKKAKYSDIFGDPAKKTPVSVKKGRGRPSGQKETPTVTSPVRKLNKGNSDYKVHILVQTPKLAPSQPSDASTPSTSRAGSEPADDKPEKTKSSSVSTPAPSCPGQFTCHACNFTTTRMNVMVLHNKSHSSTFIPYTPTPVRKKQSPKATPKSTPTTSKTSKPRRPRKEKTENEPKKTKGKKRSADALASDDAKKSKTDAEIKSSLLADWDDEGEADYKDESSSVVLPGSPEIPVAPESPAVEPAEQTGAVVPSDSSSPVKKQSDDFGAEKASSDSKYEFCEDEDWAVEAEGGRRIIPRIKNPSKRKSESKSVSLDDEDVAKEVAELLSKTTVPELPSAPEPLKAEENFPEPSLVKSPDKPPERSAEVTKSPEKSAEKPVTKTIFKTKTFFRSRHSRSQDAIGKYVAEQLNAAERMNTSESDVNGSEVASSPEARDSPTADIVKVTRLAPKIQLKRMKAELAQLAERERLHAELKADSSELTDDKKELLINAEISDYVMKETIPPVPVPEPDRTFARTLKTSKASLKTFDDAVNLDNKTCESDVSTVAPNIFSDETDSRTDTPTNNVEPEIILTQPETVTKADTIEADTIEAGTLEADTIEADTIEADTIEADTVKADIIEADTIEADTIEADIIEADTIKADIIEADTIEADIIDADTIEADTIEADIIEADTIQADTIEADTIEAGTVEADIIEADTIEADTIEADTIEADTIEADTIEADTIIADIIEADTIKADTIEADTNEVKSVVREIQNIQTEDEHRNDTLTVAADNNPQANSNDNTTEIHNKIEETYHLITDIDTKLTETKYTELEADKTAVETSVDSDNKTVEYDKNTDEYDYKTFTYDHKSDEHDDMTKDDKTIGHDTATIESNNKFTEIESQISMPETNLEEHALHEEIVQDETNGNEVVIEELIEVETSNLIQPQELLMNESTASAVDALLSVSRDADKVANVIGDDPPENLFEDDKLETNAPNENGKELLNNGGTNNFSLDTIEERPGILNGDKPGKVADEIINDFCDNMEIDLDTPVATEEVITEETSEEPTESDLQIAEALMNLPSTALKNKAKQEHHVIAQPSMSFESQEPEQPVVSGSSLLKNSTSPEYTMKHEPTVSIPETSSINADNRFESEQELSENYNAAQSLVQMSETVDLKLKSLLDKNTVNDKSVGKLQSLLDKIDQENSVEQNVAALSEANQNESSIVKPPKYETTSSKLLKMLEEPSAPKFSPIKTAPTKLIINTTTAKEKILNFDVSNSPLKSKTPMSKQKIIIRRTVTTKNLINNMNEPTKTEKIVLSRTNKPTVDGPSVQTYTIQASPDTPADSNTIVIQQKMRKIVQTPPKLQKIKPQTSLVTMTQESSPVNQTVTTEEALFDINSMPIVLSDDILTPESIEKMPIVMSDGNIISNHVPSPSKPKPKLSMTKLIEPLPQKPNVPPASTNQGNKVEIKTVLMNSTTEPSKTSNTPNILSKSSKLRGSKPMLVIDKATGNKKIIMTKADNPTTLRELKKVPSKLINQVVAANRVHTMPSKIQAVTTKIQAVPTKIQSVPTKIQSVPTKIQSVPTKIQPVHAKIQTVATKIQTVATKVPTPAKLQQSKPQAIPGKSEKFIIVPTQAAPRAARTQKIVIDPHTGKAHVLLGKEQPAENKPVSAQLVPAAQDAAQGGTVMIITNAQGTQSRIVLTPEHERLLFPNKQATQAKQGAPQAKQSAPRPLVAQVTSAPAKPPPARLVAKQKSASAIITSKGQLIVGGRVATTARNLSPAPPARRPAPRPPPAPPAQPAPPSEPLIFLQQKSGAVMQLTAAQFEHLQRTGQIVQKTSATAPSPSAPAPAALAPPDNKIVVQKSVTIKPTEPGARDLARKQKQRARPAPAPLAQLAPAPAPALAPVAVPPPLAPISCGSSYSDLDNLEDLLPSTAIARPLEAPAPEPAPAPAPVPAAAPAAEGAPGTLADGQLMAVPGEHFGGLPGSFYLCVEDAGTLTPIDHRPLVLEDNQLVPMPEPEPALPAVPAVHAPRRDILEAALANSDVFHAEPEPEPAPAAPAPAPAPHCIVSETSSTLHRPIMSPAEAPRAPEPPLAPPARSIDAGLAVIGVTRAPPSSLELPITVTDPRIAPRRADPLGAPPYASGDFPPAPPPISMPLLTDEDPAAAGAGAGAGMSMPILTDEPGGASSSPHSAVSPGSPGSPDGGGWGRRLLTPGSDESDGSAEIPLQPAIQISVSELARDS